MSTDPQEDPRPRAAVIGSGPAGLAAAEMLAHVACVTVYDAMPAPGRKFLLAGKSGLNLTHAEPLAAFLGRFGPARGLLEPAIRAFPPTAIRHWAAELGVPTFTGSSGRVFPQVMKASPLLRAWLARLDGRGVRLALRHRWEGWTPEGALRFATPDGARDISADVTVLALGGASWPRLGTTGAWITLLSERGVTVQPLRPANCGFDVDWSPRLAETVAGAPVKPVLLSFGGSTVRGEFVVTAQGIEGSAVYALSAALRDAIERDGSATLSLDLVPGRSLAQLTAALSRQRGKASLATRLRKACGIEGVKAALLREPAGSALPATPAELAALLKSLPLTLTGTRPIAEAISSAGGVALDEIGQDHMLEKFPGVFIAGEMLDWEAPTGGYLLTACLATGRAAGSAAARWVVGESRST
jgi:uncharacterized flavoprotein (TIGR03862 family)